MVNFILHAGLHKTATTSLQEQVFPAAAGVFYTGKSRQVMAARKTKAVKDFIEYCKEDNNHVRRLPSHTCAYYLSLLQDKIIAAISRSMKSIDSLQPKIQLMRELLEQIDTTSNNPTILYSCEGLLNCRGHVQPELSTKINDKPPLFLHQQLFPGSIEKIVIYTRSPIDYLYSRYIQIHVSRMHAAKVLAISPSDYLNAQAQLYSGKTKQQSVFYHVFQKELAQDLSGLGPALVIRSYEKHIRDATSISSEIKKVFNLDVLHAEQVDLDFKQKHLNTTDRDKDDAVELILSHMKLSDPSDLKQEFTKIAQENSLVQASLASRLFSY